MSKKKKTVLSIIITFMLLAALYIFNIDSINRWLIDFRNPNQSEILDNKARKAKKSDFDKVQVDSLNTTDLNKRLLSSKPDFSMSDKYISMPAVNIGMPIFNSPGRNGDNLMYGVTVANYYSKLGKNNFVLAGHTMNKGDGLYFEPLFRTQNGMKVYISTKKKKYTFKVDGVYPKLGYQSQQIHKLINADSKKPRLTMYTCDDVNLYTGYSWTRLVVTAKLVKTAKIK